MRFLPLGRGRKGLNIVQNPSPPNHRPAAPLPREGCINLIKTKDPFLTNKEGVLIYRLLFGRINSCPCARLKRVLKMVWRLHRPFASQMLYSVKHSSQASVRGNFSPLSQPFLQQYRCPVLPAGNRHRLSPG